ncbi:MAG: type II secretion system protein [Kiritimatiellaceae bacterium]|nr:type II secretion system protein [Kiritimatiellaceae bacterium]
MKKKHSKSGATLIEVLIAVMLIAVAAVVICTGIFYSYKTVMRSRARLDAQGIAFDKLWEIYNQPLDVIEYMASAYNTDPTSTSTPPGSVFSDQGFIQWAVEPDPDPDVKYWKITVQVWAPSNSPLFSVIGADGTVIAVSPEPVAEYQVLRYAVER